MAHILGGMRYDPEGEVLLEVEDCFGSIVKMHKKNYDKHKDRHPELRQKQFCPGQIVEALERPTLVIQSKQEGALCYYLELLRIRDIVKYAKVVVDETRRKDKICFVKTAFKTDHVQELKYGYDPMRFNNNHNGR